MPEICRQFDIIIIQKLFFVENPVIFHREMNQFHAPQQVQIEKDHCAQREGKGGKGGKNLSGQTADGQSDSAAYGQSENRKKDPVP